MEEEQCDYRSPIGKIIKQMNTLSKKPKLDEELGLALDVFYDKICKQQVYLKNGIFNINFAEAALLLQSCADLYGKKVDLLWDQLLEYHTRLIEYDCEHEKEKGNKLNKEVINKLEERRNRYKRKKKFKLVLSCDDNIDGFIFDKPLPPTANTFESDTEVHKKWKNLEWKSAKITSIPNAIYKQQLTMYRMKNYYTMKHQNYDVYDTEDGEFNIKYGRIPGWHFIQHLFEYNEKGLLPDKNNLIATLRLGSYLRLAFMRDNKIPLNSEYNVYKDRYLAFKKKFFEQEAKKWQNMPLDTMEDLHKQLQYLAEREREGLEQRNPHNESLPNEECSGTILGDDGTETRKNSEDIELEKLIDESDIDSLFELSFKCDDLSRTDLCIRLQKLSTDVLNTKSRQDSGFFDRVSSDSEDDSNRDAEFTEDGNNNHIGKDSTENSDPNKTTENSVPNEDAIVENCGISPESATTVDNSPEIAATIDNSTTPQADMNNLVTPPGNNDNLVTMPATIENFTMAPPIIQNLVTEPSTIDNLVTLPSTVASKEHPKTISDDNKENVDPNSDKMDNFDTRSVVSEHSYCRTPIPIPRKVLEENKDILTRRNVIAKKNIMSPFVSSLTMIIPRPVRPKTLGNIEKQGQENSPSPSKRRKLSQKQLVKLLDKMILLPTVKENKFEHFFTKNYQPQLGEGEIEEMEYESESEADEDFRGFRNVSSDTEQEFLGFEKVSLANTPLNPPQDDNQSIFSDHNYSQPPKSTPRAKTVHSQDDTVSVFSDHNYSHPADDSGFLDGTANQTENEQVEQDGPTIESSGRNGETRESAENAMETAESATLDPREQEYQRLLKALKDSRRTNEEEIEATPEELRSEQHRREQERRESRARVDQWKDTINPILRNLHETDFNIHEYGSNVMEGMEVNQSRQFAAIVDGKSSAEVVRYFIASLQLANTYNIEICGAKKGELSNDTFAVKLLKHDRYHEHLTDYQAPSEETFRERLKRVRTIREKEDNDLDEPGTKKYRNSETPKSARQSRIYSKKNNTSSNTRILVESPLRTEDSTFDEVLFSRLATETKENTPELLPVRATRGSTKSAVSNPIKGKSIVKIAIPRLGVTGEDFSAPSTSRHVHWPDTSDFSCDSNFSATEESFRECLISEQQQNPDVQLQSSPKGAFA